ncbi:hypothetical protein [Marinimicrobium locisalis]|uniref:hypothetical protein n=1 Tax=Marinimicrobium locisalis TaxID=546022 RepID=UPI003221ED34
MTSMVRWCALIAGLTWAVAAYAEAPERVYYRYVNDEGVKVVEDRIPPKYVPKGYEIVSMYGEVLETVPPAPSKEEVEAQARAERLRREREAYNTELKRRYSTTKDIRDAKRRSLAELQSNISILEGNLSNIRAQVRDLEARAARMERSGQSVSDSVLENLKTLKTEAEEVKAQIASRQEEYEQVEAKYDQDIERFKDIQAAEQRPASAAGDR